MPLEPRKALRQAELGLKKTRYWGKGARCFDYVLPPTTSPDAYIFPGDESAVGAGRPMCARQVKDVHARARAVAAQLVSESGVQDQPAPVCSMPNPGGDGDNQLLPLRNPGGETYEQYVFKNPGKYGEWRDFLKEEGTPSLRPTLARIFC